jgi:hypothetical protein
MSVMIQLNTASCRPMARQLGIVAMRESRMRLKSHVRFGEGDRETHSTQVVKVRPVPTLRSPALANMALDGLEALTVRLALDGA